MGFGFKMFQKMGLETILYRDRFYMKPEIMISIYYNFLLRQNRKFRFQYKILLNKNRNFQFQCNNKF